MPGYEQDCIPFHRSPWEYQPSLYLNGILLGIFGVSMIANLIQGVAFKTWSFMAAMVLGCIFEVVGYVGRILAHDDMEASDPFLIQICCLTLAPAFLAAGIYLCLSRIVVVFGADISRIPPKGYTYIFVACDFISLILQGAGGGIASVAANNNESSQTGTNIMLAGLGFQVFTLTLFMGLCAEYGWRVYQRAKSGAQLDAVHAKLRASKRFRLFLVALSVSTICIFIRSIFRVVELAEGWDGALMANQTLFFILEGVMVAVSVLVLNVFHPGWCFSDGYHTGKKSSTNKAISSYHGSSEVELQPTGNNTHQPPLMASDYLSRSS
ncbi:RTA1 like protein-domain-containing protein [Kalaharituber pfeilii]|nr:RTA1 like protein-domain-containing protein [Kalaharituber pfeilii]